MRVRFMMLLLSVLVLALAFQVWAGGSAAAAGGGVSPGVTLHPDKPGGVARPESAAAAPVEQTDATATASASPSASATAEAESDDAEAPAAATKSAAEVWMARIASLPPVTDRTVLHCTDDKLDGSDGNVSVRDASLLAPRKRTDEQDDEASSRSCVIQNACIDANSRWVFYAGEGAPTAGPGTRLCIGSACDGIPFLHLLPLRFETDDIMLRPNVVPGKPGTLSAAAAPAGSSQQPPAENAVRWFDESQPVFVQSRHQPSNYFHVVS